MALTRPTVAQLNTVVTEISDPVTVLNKGSTQANVDVGFVFNRDSGASPNVAFYWNETLDSLVVAYTTSTGGVNSNIAVSSYANLTVGNLISPNIYSASSGNVNLNLYSSGTGQTYVRQSTGGAYGLNLAQDIVSGGSSARLYFLGSSGHTAIYNSGGTLFFNTSASPGTSSGFPQVKIAPTGTAVNWLQLTGSATGNTVPIAVDGTDANISIALDSKGTGAIDLVAGSSGVNISNGNTVTAITRTAAGSGYTTPPTVAISAPTTASGVQATATVTIGLVSVTSVANGGTGYTVGNVLTVVGGTSTVACQVTVTAVSSGVITAASVTTGGSYTVAPTNPVSVTGGSGSGATFNLSFCISTSFTITNAGSGYVEQPTITFSGGGGSGAAAYATVGSNSVLRGIGSTVSIYSAGGEQARFGDTFTAGISANYCLLQGRAAGAQPAFGVGGTDTNISAQYNTKGTGQHLFYTNGGAQLQLAIAHTASAVNYVQVTGAATGSRPTISAQGSDTNIDLILTSKGSGNITTANTVVISNSSASTSTTSGALIVTGGVGIGGNVIANGNITTVGGIFVGNITGKTNGFTLGYLEMPQVASGNVTLALSDSGKHFYNTTASPQTITVPSFANVAFGNGTVISIANQSTSNISVALQSEVILYLAGNATSASRTITSYGVATLLKVNTNTWFINGSGVV